MNIDELVKQHLESATKAELLNIIEHGVEVPEGDMMEALENAYIEHAKEKLNALKK